MDHGNRAPGLKAGRHLVTTVELLNRTDVKWWTAGREQQAKENAESLIKNPESVFGAGLTLINCAVNLNFLRCCALLSLFPC